MVGDDHRFRWVSFGEKPCVRETHVLSDFGIACVGVVVKFLPG